MSREDETYRPIRAWNENDRPREKLERIGRAHLSDAELIAILLGSGTRNESAVEVARRMLHSVNDNLVEFGKLTIPELQQFQGVGPAKAITLTAAIELGRRRQEAAPLQRKQVHCSKDIHEIFSPRIGDLPHEEFWAMCLNRSNKIINSRRISSGGISSTVADIRLIMRFAIESNASTLIICHNHPSGNLKPSEQDIRITKSIAQAVKYLDIQLLDHLIVTESGFYSFSDEGIIAS
ncbi:MAG: DNA repair protein RadC [Bacteroidia bacterium]